ncbi:hypothetical protein CFBP5877_27740 (plasmid) [Agrobacterium tumefaciens]|uniref:Uncharacterized protein n=1 Tax=Agrobacterium tumefaciens TaxID=358 RepID=A0AAE6BJ28_AGRTU|nr:hypothetical protein [Agrobacterium tumefaciens]QCL82905.1 hypothetical protein CFBP5877_27740 [Agrobacterium tumefaciens]
MSADGVENAFGIGHEYYRLLEDNEIILPGSNNAKGFYFIRGWGSDLLDALVKHFEASISISPEVTSRSPKLVVNSDLYDGEVAGFGGFDGVFRLNWFGSQCVLRPDAALGGLRELVGRLGDGNPRDTLAVFQGFRNVKGGTPTLFRDRFIYPFVQYNRLVKTSDVGTETEGAIGALVGFFDSLGIPVRVLDFGPWKNYAKRLFAIVSHSKTGSPTILSMFFIVGDIYRELAGIPDAYEAFDIGITEKVLGFCVLLHRANGLQFPSSISPAQVVVQGDFGDFGDLPRDKQLRIVFTDLPQEEAFRVWIMRRGVPLLLTKGRRSTRIFSRSRRWEDFHSSFDLAGLLKREDNALTEAAMARLDESANPSLFLPEGEKADDAQGIKIISQSPSLVAMKATRQLRRAWPEGRTFY